MLRHEASATDETGLILFVVLHLRFSKKSFKYYEIVIHLKITKHY